MRNKVISQDQILKIAGDLVKERGVKACSMRTLAKEANIAVGTLYNYFPSNQVLLEELYVSSWCGTINRLEEISIESVIETQIKELYMVLKEEIKARKGLGKELNSINAFAGKLGESKIRIHGRIEKIIFRFLKKAKIKKDCSENQLMIISRWIFFASMDSILLDKREDEEIIEMIIKCFIY